MKRRTLAAVVAALGLLATVGSGTVLAIHLPPTLTMSFEHPTLAVGAHMRLTFEIANPNTTLKMWDVAFTDTLPAGLVISSPVNLGGTCPGAPGIAIIANAGDRYIKMTHLDFDGANLGGALACTLQLDIKGVAAGVQTNTTTAPTGRTTDPLVGDPATGTVTVLAAPTIAAAFTPSTINAGGTTGITFTVTNPAANPASLTGVGFNTTLPAGLTVLGDTVEMCGGVVRLTAPREVLLSGATIAPGRNCQFSLNFNHVAAGSYTVGTGTVSSANGGNGASATARLTVRAVTATPAPTPTATPTIEPTASPDAATPTPSTSPTATPTAEPTATPTPSPQPSASATATTPPSGDGGSNAPVFVGIGLVSGLAVAGAAFFLYLRSRHA